MKPLVLATFFAVVRCFSVAALGQELPTKPTKLWAVIANFDGSTYRVELRGDTLQYEHVVGAESGSTEITPSAAQWLQFRKALDRIGVWDWKSSYVPEEVVFDGTDWSFSIRYSDRGVFTSGENCYPEVDASRCTDVRTPKFLRLESAIEALLGGKPFSQRCFSCDEMRSNQAMQLTASKPPVYASSVCRRERMLRAMHGGLAAADLVTR